MDFRLFSSVLNNLLNVSVLVTSKENPDLASFSEKYCYHPVLQPAFTLETLTQYASQMQEKTIYDLRDDLGICIQFFLIEESLVIVGPFVRNEFPEAKVQSLLISHSIPASYSASVRLYYSSFPLLSATHTRDTILGCIRAFVGQSENYYYQHLRKLEPNGSLPHAPREESLDYLSIYHRYDLENRFLRTIETGDTENVLIAQYAMSADGMNQNRYVNAVYQDPVVGISMIRALARKAAERGGASLIDIHEITQRNVQRTLAAKNVQERVRYLDQMLVELSEAVRISKQHMSNYSAPIRRVAEYIGLNFSQEISLDQLADLIGYAPTYLSKTFTKEVGMTITRYIAMLRCQKAAQMLRDEDLTVQEISHYVGYMDNNYFVKVFKKQYGMTPTEYRKEKEP
ncbi:MAG: helix-turn-helix transcriptional regulator [Lachnospiraceae bacterium]|nr:helix-turn-helix transcriptional regulator [Lachnospiraceae bacterium]